MRTRKRVIVQTLIDFGMQVLFSFLGYDVTVFELIASATSLLGVMLGVTGKRITWPWWVLSSALYAVLFWQWDLKASALLQFVFIAAGIMGWFEWGPKGAVPAKLSRNELLMWLGITIIGWVSLRPVFESWGAASTWADTFVLVGSIVAQILMVLEKYEAWPLWTVVDLVGTVLYASMSLWFTSALYGVFTIVAVVGWREWLRRANERTHV